MTKQEIFDRAWHGVTRQRGLSFSGNDVTANPRYQCGHGRRCSIGHACPDENRYRLREGYTITGHADWSAIMGVEYNADNCHFLNAIQQAHDDSNSLAEFASIMAQVATQYGLTVPPMPEGGAS